MLIFIAITGWTIAALLALGFYSCRKNNQAWRKLYEEKAAQLREAERKTFVAEFDRDAHKWANDEIVRLRNKCEAICAQVRKMKGRGRGTCEIHPRHSF